MTILLWFLLALGIYLACGFGMTLLLLQTPYAESPLWAMFLLWPLYLLAILGVFR
jgi:hypothetical protein